MATKSVGFPANSKQVLGVSGSRSVRLPDEQPASPLLQPAPPRVSLEGERPILHMGRLRLLRLPITSINSSGSNECDGGQPVTTHSNSPPPPPSGRSDRGSPA